MRLITITDGEFCLAVFTDNFFKYTPTWQNELKSVMRFTTWNITEGLINGRYCSNVGNAEDYYNLQGTFDNCGNTIAWTVTYQNVKRNAHSTCGWSGRIAMDDKANPIIFTTWLLTSKTKPGSEWASTKIGFNTFKIIKTPQNSTCA